MSFREPRLSESGRGGVTNCYRRSERDLSLLNGRWASKKERLSLEKEEGEEGKGRKARHNIEK